MLHLSGSALRLKAPFVEVIGVNIMIVLKLFIKQSRYSQYKNFYTMDTKRFLLSKI